MKERVCNAVDVKDLKKSKELESSIEDDTKRATINSVKLRAAAQNVDYPAFAALVSCAHLKPMTRKELDTRERKDQTHNRSIPAWSFDPRGINPSIPNTTVKPIPSTHVSHNASWNIDQIAIHMVKVNKLGTCAPVYDERGSHLSCFRNPLFESNYEVSTQKSPTTTNHDVVSLQTWDMNSTLPATVLEKGESDCKDSIMSLENVTMAETDCKQLLNSCHSNYTSDLFVKEWKRLMAIEESMDRLIFLSKFPPSSFPILFKVEIPPFLLGEILDTLFASLPTTLGKEAKEKSIPKATLSVQNLHTKHDQDTISKWLGHTDGDPLWKLLAMDQAKLDAQKLESPIGVCNYSTSKYSDTKKVYVKWIASVMNALSNCGRFGLAVKLMGHKARHAAAAILDFISDTITETLSLNKQSDKYREL